MPLSSVFWSTKSRKTRAAYLDEYVASIVEAIAVAHQLDAGSCPRGEGNRPASAQRIPDTTEEAHQGPLR